MTTVIKFLFAQALISSRQLGERWMRMRSLLQPQLVQLGRLQVLDKALELGVDALDVVVDNLHSQEQMAWSGKVKVLIRTAKIRWGRFLVTAVTVRMHKDGMSVSSFSQENVMKALRKCAGKALGFACICVQQ